MPRVAYSASPMGPGRAPSNITNPLAPANGGGGPGRSFLLCPNLLLRNMLEFDHIALSVPNIAEAIAFYREKFPQVAILHEDETWAFLQIDGLKIAFVLEEQHPPHLAFRVDTHEMLERLASDAESRIML